MRIVAVVVLVVACGRVGFDPLPDGAGGPVGADGPTDASRLATPRVLIYGTPVMDTMLEAYLTPRVASLDRVDDAAVMDSSLLVNVDLVIVQELNHAHSTGESTVLRAWVAAGGSLMTLSGYFSGDDAFYNPLLADLGAQFDGTVDLQGPITEFAAHPATQNLSSIPYMGGYALQLDTSWTTVAKHASGPVGAVSTIGAGRAYIWGDDWVSYDQVWCLPDDPTFWVDTITWLRHLS